MKEYTVITIIDSQVEQKVRAKSKKQAIQIAERNLETGNYDDATEQIIENAQHRDSWIDEE